MSANQLSLVWPTVDLLPQYIEALGRGWSPDNARGLAAAQEELEQIRINQEGFVAGLIDREANGKPITLPDGSSFPRLPGYRLWLWDGAFCGSIGFRWQFGTSALPPYVLGHVGYSVVPWKQRRGYATMALRLLLPRARREGLEYIEITTDADNVASQKVIRANGGVQIESFQKPSEYGGHEGLRFQINLAGYPEADA